ncbi:MAG TPA: acylphosphatase [Candidatus Cloacimonadota bacterium]|nr:acylphosphatase [Candidatus Cloacimonadota bacterium]HPT72017.1 acylphosphatase [Candidatus Cloacimonadota bacterium]
MQGVGYRWFVKRQADLYQISGYVKNQLDGSVKIIAQGEEFQTDAFIAIITRGSDFTHISDTEISTLTAVSDYKEFFIAT